MKTAIQGVMDIIEMEHNNGVEISQRVLWKMLLEAKGTEKKQIIDAYSEGMGHYGDANSNAEGLKYYTSTFETNKETLK